MFIYIFYQQEKPSTLKEKIKARRPSAKDLIAYVLNKAQQSEEVYTKLNLLYIRN
jgi:hypothetical protein